MPATLTPVVVTTITLLVPPTLTVTLLPELGMFTLLVPLAILVAVPPPIVHATPFAYNKLSVLILPAVTLPVTLKLVSVPTDVMLGCAPVCIVPR